MLNQSRRPAPGPDGVDELDNNTLRLGHLVADMYNYRTPNAISAKFGPARTLSRDEIERTILEERDANGKTVSRKSVREWVEADPTKHTYYYWATAKEDLYVAYPNVRDRFARSRAVWRSRDQAVVHHDRRRLGDRRQRTGIGWHALRLCKGVFSYRVARPESRRA